MTSRATHLRPLWFVAALVVAAGVACSSHEDNVCQDVGDCARGGDTDWIGSCQAEAKMLGAEAADGGCAADFNGYYSCADSNYTCHGATALFPGCDDALAALDACLAAATASSACARLTTKETTCDATPARADAGTGTDAGPPPACTAARDCQAACYLADVVDVCAPRVDEIQLVSTCAASCPP